MRAVRRIRSYIRFLGPGIITGAADDDPSGITTYSIVGASTGYNLLWLSLYTIPMAVAVQVMSARIGLVTKQGLAKIIKEHYGLLIILASAFVVLASNIVTIAADLAGSAAAINLLVPRIKIGYLVPAVAILTAVSEVFISYKMLERYLKWVLLVLLSYVFAGFLSHPNWATALYHTIFPRLVFDKTQLTAAVAFLGTTISPYLFFWQTSQEVEELKAEKLNYVTRGKMRARVNEVNLGFIYSNTLTFFIVLTTAATLHREGITNIQTAAQAARALRPLAGNVSELLFTIGLVASGLLAIPVLAASNAYVVAELFGWNEGLSKKVSNAPRYYLTIVISIIVGIAIDYVNINPFQAMYYSQVFVGILTPVLVIVIMLVSNNKKIMGDHVNGLLANLFGAVTILAMITAAVLFFIL